MESLFYDINRSYEENYKRGPVGLAKLKKPLLKVTKPKFKFLGFPINTPFGIPAGPIFNSKFAKAAFDFGFDVLTYKTQRTQFFPSNKFPNILFVDIDGNLTSTKAKNPLLGAFTTNKNKNDLTIANSFGNPSQDPKFWQQDLKKALSYALPHQLLIMSVVGTINKNGGTEEDYFNDFAKTAKLAKETGTKVIEINLSCPNVATEGVLCYTPYAVEAIAKKVKKTIGGIPLIIKLGYFSSEQQNLLQDIIKRTLPYVSAVSAINTIPGQIVDEKGKPMLGPKRLWAGVCGRGIKWAGIDMTRRLADLREKLHANYEIVGIGGVMSPNDYLEYRKAGADAVQSATGSMWNPYLAYEIWKSEYL